MPCHAILLLLLVLLLPPHPKSAGERRTYNDNPRPQRAAQRPPVNVIQLRWPQGPGPTETRGLRLTTMRKSGIGTGGGSGSAAGVSLRGSFFFV